MDNEVQQIISDMTHRTKLLDSLSRSLKGLERKTAYHSVEQKKAIHKVLSDVRQELTELETEISTVKKLTKKIGDELKRKIRIGEFEEVKTSVDTLNFESRISREELKKSYAHYATK